jgi:hypothetical protein
MKPRVVRWIYLVAGVAAAFVAVSVAVQGIRQGSWGPIISVGWIPAVIAAMMPAARYRQCRTRRGNPAA